ncbi:hypothetical protein, partial [Streptococcus pneumoniae]|uniref:hypothetical protein n=1 Tax=Streptococcus pneumoniae TaxID=1313 RepID=UPI000A59DFE3
NLFKPRQRRLAVYMLLTSSVLSATSKPCFEQPAASFLVCTLIFIEYKKILGKDSISVEKEVNLPTLKRIVSSFFNT